MYWNLMNIIVLPGGYPVPWYRVLGMPHIRGVHYIPYPISNIISQVDAQSSNPEYWASPIFGVFIISGVFGNCLVCLAISTERYIYEKRPQICFYLWIVYIQSMTLFLTIFQGSLMAKCHWPKSMTHGHKLDVHNASSPSLTQNCHWPVNDSFSAIPNL